MGTKTHFKLRETLPGFFHTGHGYGESNFAFSFSDHNGTQPSGPSGTWCIGFGFNGKLPDPKDSKHIVEMINRDIIPGTTVDAYATHDWAQDPYAKGVWACWSPHGTSAYLEELQKPHGRIAFASADWADGWRGFVDGAIEQGQVAARTIAILLESAEVAPKL